MKLQDVKSRGYFWNPNNKKVIYEVYPNTSKQWLEERPQDDFIVDIWEYDYTEKDCIYFYTDGVPISREYCPNIDMEEIIQYNFELIDESGFLMVARRKNASK